MWGVGEIREDSVQMDQTSELRLFKTAVVVYNIVLIPTEQFSVLIAVTGHLEWCGARLPNDSGDCSMLILMKHQSVSLGKPLHPIPSPMYVSHQHHCAEFLVFVLPQNVFTLRLKR